MLQPAHRRLRTKAFKALLVCLSALGISTSVQAQTSLDALLLAETRQHAFPAMAAAVMVKGKLVAIGAAGTRRAGATVPVTRQDRFHLGSDTKAMTALLVGMLVDEGKLRWDSTLAEVFPELAARMDAGFKNVTVSQLLAHTSGMPAEGPDFGALIMAAVVQDGSIEQQRYWVLEQVMVKPLVAVPGSRFAYSNIGYMLAGSVIEKLSRRSWEEQMVERIFEPLGLQTAGFGSQARIGRVDAPLGHRFVDGQVVPVPGGPDADAPAILGPAGTVHMSVLDFARWGSWMAGQGQRAPRIAQPATLQKLVTPVIDMPTDPNRASAISGVSQYALGWVRVKMPWADHALPFHGGSNTTNKAHIWLDTRRDATIVVLTNIATPNTEDAMMALAGKLYTRFVQLEKPQGK